MNKKLVGQRAGKSHAHRVAAIAAGVALTFGIASSAHADGAAVDWGNMFTFSGFGTVGMTHSSLDTADYTTNYFQDKGAGASSQYNFSDDTKVAGQVNAQFTSQLSAVVQVIMQENYNNSYTPTIEWANIKYAITPDLDVRVGRIALPTFLSSDDVNVGYANPWAHAPVEVYNLVPVDSSDGVDASYTLHLGKVDNTVHVFYGVDNTRAPNPFAAGDVKFDARNILGAFDTVEQGAFTARGGYMQANLNYGPFEGVPVTFYTAGADYDPGNWFVQAEWAHAKVGKLTPGYDSWYVIGGYRIQKFTPYAMYSMVHSQGNQLEIPNTNQGQKDYSAGVRWDFYKNLDLKVQFDHVVLPANSEGYFVNAQQGFVLGSTGNIVSAVLDFVF